MWAWQGTWNWENGGNSRIQPCRNIPSISKYSLFSILYPHFNFFYSSLSYFMTVKRIDFSLQLIELLSIWRNFVLCMPELCHFLLLIPSFYIYPDFLQWRGLKVQHDDRDEWATELFFGTCHLLCTLEKTDRESILAMSAQKNLSKIFIAFFTSPPIRNFVSFFLPLFSNSE